MEVDDTHPRPTPAVDDGEDTIKREPCAPGLVISGRYRLETMLAAGGMGEVYRAVHLELGRPFALKLMRPELSADPAFVDRFRREAMTASRLGHPNIVDIVDSGRSESGQFYFVMELLEGRTLSELVRDGALPLPLALELTMQVGRALEVAHGAGVVHRDLKPDNVIVLPREPVPVAKVVDFGIAKVVTPSPGITQTMYGVIMGTPQYMAPEQAAGVALDARADIYALGLILFELLTGVPPLTGATAALVMSAHISNPAPRLPDRFPSALRDLVARMLAKRPADRPASMTEVLGLLARVPRAETPPRRRAIVAVVAVSAIALAVAWLSSHTPAISLNLGTASDAGAALAVRLVPTGSSMLSLTREPQPRSMLVRLRPGPPDLRDGPTPSPQTPARNGRTARRRRSNGFLDPSEENRMMSPRLARGGRASAQYPSGKSRVVAVSEGAEAVAAGLKARQVLSCCPAPHRPRRRR